MEFPSTSAERARTRFSVVRRFIIAILYVSGHVYVKNKIIDIPDRSRIINVMAKKRKNPYAVELGRKGGKVGGKARAANMTPEERSESARNAVLARWSKAKEKASSDR
jgi:hypothetical protein